MKCSDERCQVSISRLSCIFRVFLNFDSCTNGFFLILSLLRKLAKPSWFHLFNPVRLVAYNRLLHFSYFSTFLFIVWSRRAHSPTTKNHVYGATWSPPPHSQLPKFIWLDHFTTRRRNMIDRATSLTLHQLVTLDHSAAPNQNYYIKDCGAAWRDGKQSGCNLFVPGHFDCCVMAKKLTNCFVLSTLW